MTSKNLTGAILLKLQHGLAAIGLVVCLSGGVEQCYDAMEAAFVKIVSLCEVIASTRTTPSSWRNRDFFHRGMGIIHPAYIAAIKCRNRAIRRRAIAVLSTAGREGVWNGPLAATVAESVITLEEAGAKDEGSIPETARVHGVDTKTNRETRECCVRCERPTDSEFSEWAVSMEVVSWQGWSFHGSFSTRMCWCHISQAGYLSNRAGCHAKRQCIQSPQQLLIEHSHMRVFSSI
ncbi:hypothetical protein MMC16_005080 [Acarospora aff. strigata]|nr:hypothetical protein [Acarospora aff. strigata]